jgi:hypothetical protein
MRIETIFTSLKACLEQHGRELKCGDLFLPDALTGRVFTTTFQTVMASLASMLRLQMVPEYSNRMPPSGTYECGEYQRVDYVLHDGRDLRIFVEVESLDRAQLTTFFGHRDVADADNLNKLWYYYGTLVNHYTLGHPAPRYFVWLLILPDIPVKAYQIWDSMPAYRFFHPGLNRLVYASPYRFYDPLIKTAARLFLVQGHDFLPRGGGPWTTRPLTEFQETCELVFITCTTDRLILSRGINEFQPTLEQTLPLDWSE